MTTRFTPFGLMFLIAAKFVETEDLHGILSDLGLYFVTVVAGLAVHGIIVLPLLYFALTRKSPIKFALNMSKAIFTAWGTASRLVLRFKSCLLMPHYTIKLA